MSNELPAETKMTAEEMADALLKDAVTKLARGAATNRKVVGSVRAPGQQFGPPEDAIAILKKKGYTVEFETFANDGTVNFLFDFGGGDTGKGDSSGNKKRKDVPAEDAEVDEKQARQSELAKIPRFLRADYVPVKKIIDDKAAVKRKQAVEMAAVLASAAAEAVKTAPGETTFEIKCDWDNPREIETLLWQRGWSISIVHRLGECFFKFDFAVPPFSS